MHPNDTIGNRYNMRDTTLLLTMLKTDFHDSEEGARQLRATRSWKYVGRDLPTAAIFGIGRRWGGQCLGPFVFSRIEPLFTSTYCICLQFSAFFRAFFFVFFFRAVHRSGIVCYAAPTITLSSLVLSEVNSHSHSSELV